MDQKRLRIYAIHDRGQHNLFVLLIRIQVP